MTKIQRKRRVTVEEVERKKKRKGSWAKEVGEVIERKKFEER